MDRTEDNADDRARLKVVLGWMLEGAFGEIFGHLA
jgi:hypothetical protein